jgi:hypothetical protein
MKLGLRAPWLPCCADCAHKSKLARAVAGALRGPMPIFDPGLPWIPGSWRPSEAAGPSSPCPSDPPPPAGYRVWTGAVPTELTQWAIDLLRHVNAYAYGTTWTLVYQGQNVLARKDHHTWTWRGGVLVTGICIPGITLYTSAPATVSAATDGTSAMFSSDADSGGAGGAGGIGASLSWWQFLLLGVAAGIATDELLRALGRRRSHEN